jgi:diguanylate cyclase (GGDEF)-like protein
MERIFAVVVREFSPYYLLCDPSGRLLGQGGFKGDYRFPDIAPSCLVQDEIPALFGLFPFKEKESLFLPCVGIGDGRSVDIHLFSAEEGVYVLFLDASRKESQLIVTQQFLNDAALRALKAAKGGRRATDAVASVKIDESAADMAAIDPLLLIPSRDLTTRLFTKRLELYRETGDLFGLVFVEICHFADINIHHGSDAGDAVLQEVAKILHRNLWPGDIVGRWSGVVFACLVKADADSLVGIAATLASAVGGATVRFGHARIKVVASVAATLSSEGDSIESMIRRVEAAIRSQSPQESGFSIVSPEGRSGI